MPSVMQQALLAGGASLSSVSVISATETFGATIAWPAVQAGDVAVVIDFVSHSVATPSVVPTGFTGWVATTNGGSTRLNISYKICTGSESGNITGMTADTIASKHLYIYRGNKAIASITPSTPNTQVISGNPNSQTVSASGQATPLAVICTTGVSAYVSAVITTESPTLDNRLTTNTMHISGQKIYNSSPVNHTWDCGSTGGIETSTASGFLRFS